MNAEWVSALQLLVLSNCWISNSNLTSYVIKQTKIHCKKGGKFELQLIMLIWPMLSSPSAGMTGCNRGLNYQLLPPARQCTWNYSVMAAQFFDQEDSLYIGAKVKNRSVYTSLSSNNLILSVKPTWLKDVAFITKCQDPKSHT